MQKLEYIEIDKLRPHPDNPRKDLGDLAELTESIRKNGIMQNLTVVEHGDEYRVVIGHRRLAAAEEAGLEKLPCVVADLDEREQCAMMLEENLQRSDLTVLEQAQGFQMMLDLGETVHTIREKTGFSETTIRRRLKIAELDPDIVELKTESDGSFQLTITDLAKLEKIGSVEQRNRILEDADDSQDLEEAVQDYLREKHRADMTHAVLDAYEEKYGFALKDAPDKYRNSRWDNEKWERIANYDLDSIDEDDIEVVPGIDESVFYYLSWGSVELARKREVSEEKKKEKTKEQKEREKRDKKNGQLKELMEETRNTWISWLLDVLDGNREFSKKADLEMATMNAWNLFEELNERYTRTNNLVIEAHFLGITVEEAEKWQYDKAKQEEFTKAHGERKETPVLIRMMLEIINGLYQPWDYSFKPMKTEIERWTRANRAMEYIGFKIRDIEHRERTESFINGTHKAYGR